MVFNFRTIGFTEEDIDFEYRRLPEGGAEITAIFSERGNELFEAAAAKYGIPEDEFFDALLRSSLQMPDASQDW
jgi:hypothetical protein